MSNQGDCYRSSRQQHDDEETEEACSTNNNAICDDDDIQELALNANFDPSFFDVGEMADDDEEEDDVSERLSSLTSPHQQQHADPNKLTTTTNHGDGSSGSAGFPLPLLDQHETGKTSPPIVSSNSMVQQQQQNTTAHRPVVHNHHHHSSLNAGTASMPTTAQQQLQSAAAAAYALPQQQQQQQQQHSLIGSFVAPGLYGSFPAMPPAPPPVTISASTTSTTTSNNNNNLPPFLLFDAPIELRANYMACQRARGMAVHEDTNQLHYNSAGAAAAAVKLVDGRTGLNHNKTVRNVREQKRTQKIADLIDQLRVKMEEGGWSVGIKQSKFHTLSSCGEYVKHLVKSNKEKEVALEKTKSDLEAKRRKIEEEKNNTTIGSDRESTTSSLTASSDYQTKRASEPMTKKQQEQRQPNNNQESSHSSSANSSGGDESGKQRQQQYREGQSVSCNRMTSSVSDITDSKGSSSGGTGGGNSTEQTNLGATDPNPGSILSDAAVAPGVDAHEKVTTPAGTVVVAPSRTGSSSSETTTTTSSFDLDYKEVFVKSNVPQILATTSGRIVAWNEFFLGATGLREEDAGRLTIFSLVRSNKLSSLFEIVAAALRNDDSVRQLQGGGSSSSTVPVVTDGSSSEAAGRGSASDNSSNTPSSTTSQNQQPSSPQTEAYTAITLPCTIFQKSGDSGAATLDQQLYMTVTLMTDEDPQKRCFHCVFTDCPPGVNGSMGTISREFLARLVSDTRAKNNNHSHKRKRGGRGFA